jgi:hypothetical protein
VRRVRQSYYSLKMQGLLEFRCNALPDWDLTYKSAGADKIGSEQLLPILRNTRFKVVRGPDGASTISHESDVAPPDENVAERLRKSIGGIEQALTGFYQTWSQFEFNTLLPDQGSDDTVVELDGKYRLSYQEADTAVVTTLDHDFRFEQIEITSPTWNGSLRRQWSNTENGLLLAGYGASFRTGSSASVLSVTVEYEEIEGLKLPSAINAEIPLAKGQVPIRVVFADYEIKKR